MGTLSFCRGRRAWLVAAAVALTAGVAVAKMGGTSVAPVARLLANLARELKAAPDDPHLLYLAGRTHALAYARGGDAKARIERDGTPAHEDPLADLPEFDTRYSDHLAFKGDADEARLRHLREGIRLLGRAAELAKPPADPEKDERPLLFLGLAWLLDDGSRFASRLGAPEGVAPKDDLPDAELAAVDAAIARLGAPLLSERTKAFEELRRALPLSAPRLLVSFDAKNLTQRSQVRALMPFWWRRLALDAYRRALALTRDRDLVRDAGGITISREAGHAILRLLEEVPDASAQEKGDVERHLARLDERAPVGVSPMIFPVSRAAALADLRAGGRTSRFDVAGDGVERLWPWPSAEAAFLVWIGDGSEAVTSGRQLFGERTWWIFWRDGYEPLRMLDDDADGRLAGAELDGIGVWRDRDGDGVCGAGEVESAAAFGVAWIAVRAARTEDGVPANDRGVGLADGTTRPTYDWTPRSIPETPARQ